MSDAVDARRAWHDPAWQERDDTAWTAGCRWRQARWREVELDQPPGPHREGRPDRLVASMLPLGADRSPNFP